MPERIVSIGSVTHRYAAMDPTSDSLRALIADAVRAEVEAAVAAALEERLPAIMRRAALPLYLTREELAALTGWSLRKVDYLKAQRRIPFVRRGRTVLFKTADVENYLEEGRVPARGEVTRKAGGGHVE